MPIYHRQPVELTECKLHLKRNGWTYRAAAEALDTAPSYLSDVLNGWAISAPLKQRILSLGKASEPQIAQK